MNRFNLFAKGCMYSHIHGVSLNIAKALRDELVRSLFRSWEVEGGVVPR